MSAWQAGVDGIYIFNEYNANREYLQHIGEVETMRDLPKRYLATVRNSAPATDLPEKIRLEQLSIL